MANKVGKIHTHDIPDPKDIPKFEVWQCGGCGEEFFAALVPDKTGVQNMDWLRVSASSHQIEYDEGIIGRRNLDGSITEVVAPGKEKTDGESNTGNEAK